MIGAIFTSIFGSFFIYMLLVINTDVSDETAILIAQAYAWLVIIGAVVERVQKSRAINRVANKGKKQ